MEGTLTKEIDMIAFIQANSVLLCTLAYVILECIFVFSPGLAANGIIHALFLFVQGKSQIAAPAAAPASK